MKALFEENQKNLRKNLEGNLGSRCESLQSHGVTMRLCDQSESKRQVHGAVTHDLSGKNITVPSCCRNMLEKYAATTVS